MEKRTEIRRQNRLALGMIVLALVLSCLVLCLPAYQFTANVYTLKSSNTFVGDDTYLAAKAEVEAVAETYRAEGQEVTVNEEVKERTNSKGEQTSLVTFTLTDSFSRSGWSFLGGGLPSSWVLLGIVLCLALGCACAVAGTVGSMDEAAACLDGRECAFRRASEVLSFAAVVLIPVFFMTATVSFSRKLGLYNAGQLTAGKEAFFAQLSAFLFPELDAASAETALKGLQSDGTAAIWLMLPCALVAALGGLQLRYGAIRHKLGRIALYIFVLLVCVITLYPYYVMLITAFRSAAETNDMYFLHMFPTSWKLSNLGDILERGVLRYLLNSLLIAGGATAIALLCGIPAAYAMARMKFRGKKAFLGFVIMSQMFSPVVLLIGISQLISAMGLNDSIFGLMLINAAFNQAFAIWLLRGTFVSISSEMEQAARIDGCTTVGALIRVLLPMAAPGIVTTLIFVFINAWNEYTISTVLISTASNRPITVGITQFSSFNMIEWQYLFAASLLATIPVVILFTCIEKHLTSGLTAGGVKG